LRASPGDKVDFTLEYFIMKKYEEIY